MGLDHEARLAALEAQLGQLTDACSRRRLDEHAGHIDETVVDAFFLLVAAVGVFSMQQGFAMLEVGSCAKDHTKEILLKTVWKSTSMAWRLTRRISTNAP